MEYEEEAGFEPATTVAVDDFSPSATTDKKVGSMVSYVTSLYTKSEDSRRADEQRWITCYRNYRGLYGPDVKFTDTEKSRVFVKVTKTKTLAAYSQITDVLFGASKFPLSVDPTTLPDGVSDSVHYEPDAATPEAVGALQNSNKPVPLFGGSEKLLPGETLEAFKVRLGGMKAKLAPVADKLIEGPGTTAKSITFHPAMIAAKKMEKKIHDQLEECGASKHLRMTATELVIFGTGIMKGPVGINKEYPNWDEKGEYKPIIKLVPTASHVSVWNFYPDPDASNMEESEYAIERHKMSRSQLRKLKERPMFRANAVNAAIKRGENYVKKWWETVMEDGDTDAGTNRYEVLEFWGYLDTDTIKANGVDIPTELRGMEQLSVNVWICNGEVLRLVMNPYKPSIIPYYAVPYEINPYSFFGVGLAENMEDTQMLMNGFMRMAVDNAVLSGNLVFEVDETNLVPGQDMKVYPGKVFRRQGGAPGQAIFGTKFPNVSNENMQLFDKARVLADESTGFPSFAHGQTGVSGVGRTASGISMLMGAANGSIRTVVKNIDDYLLMPLGKAFFSFNMQFDYDPEIRGDLEVKAQGTESLMANEVRSQRLMQFLQTTQNPALLPFVKADYIIREIAKSLDLDPDKVTNSLSDAALQAEILKEFTAAAAPLSPPMQGGAPPVADNTGAGGGNIGTGAVPTPGEAGFAANNGSIPQ